MSKTSLKDIIKTSNDKSTVIGKEKYSDTLAARIAKADQVLGLENEESSKTAKVDSVEKLLISLPKDEFNDIDIIIQRFLQAGKHVTKSELFRLGLYLVKNNDVLISIEKLGNLKKLKSGRKKSI